MDPKLLAEEINKTHEDVIGMISKLTDEDINAIPFAGSWTAGQVADHIIKSTDGIPDDNTRRADRVADEQIDAIKSLFLDFTVKFQAPEFIAPDRGPFETGLILAELQRIKKQNVAIALTRDLTELCVDFALPGFGYLTRYEWLKFTVYHTQRHIHQLKNIEGKVFLSKAQPM